jgi:hypothetical protein
LPEGGQNQEYLHLYEIVSEKGIEELKEYSDYSNPFCKNRKSSKKMANLYPLKKGDGILVFSKLESR